MTTTLRLAVQNVVVQISHMLTYYVHTFVHMYIDFFEVAEFLAMKNHIPHILQYQLH